MNSMLSAQSHTRVTLALDIVRRIEEGQLKGFHELNVIKHQITLFDEISVAPAVRMGIRCNDSRVPTDSSNICWIATDIIKQACGISENIEISLVKNIPVQGGLAGGSANAATVMMLLNELWGLQLSNTRLMELGALAGRDVPFYFTGGTCFDTETGIIQPVKTNCKLSLVCAIPRFGVSTREAYAGLDYMRIAQARDSTAKLRESLELGDIDAVAQSMHNDFECSVFFRFPALAALKQKLLDAGCLSAIMSGSGSTIIGLARDKTHALKICENIGEKCLCVESFTRN